MKVLLSQVMCHRLKQLDKAMSGEYGNWGRTSHLSIQSRFSLVLQHVAKHYYLAKSLSHISAHIVAVFSSMLSSNASIVVDSNLL